MANTINYDPDEDLCSPLPDASYKVLSGVNSPIFSGFTTSDTTSNVYPSANTSNTSSPQSIPFSPNLFTRTDQLIQTKNESFFFPVTAQNNERIRIIAQPKASYRERYCSETDPSKNRAQRFIRADDDTDKHEYPTIEIPSKWCDFDQELYIRVTLVTILSDNVPVHCIHPYTIDTQEVNVLRDPYNNSLYFPINRDDIFAGKKSFRISRKKMIQHDLKSYGHFHIFDSNRDDIQRVMNPHDPKQIIETYQLWKSQLIFTIAKRSHPNHLPIAIASTLAISQIMCDEAGRRDKITAIDTKPYDDDSIKCTPRKGNWNGGDEILMTIPRLDRRKVFYIYFDYGSMGKLDDLKISFVDSKTIFFQTPPCPIVASERNLTVPIIVTQSDTVIAHIDFMYLTATKPIINICSHCQCEMMNNNYMNNKRRYFILDSTETDGAESLVQHMNRLTTEEKHIESSRRQNNDDKIAKIDKYLGQLQDAIVEFVRTNNPSRLFRRTRVLLTKCDQNPSPLDDAIRRGHIDIALRLIEQIIDMSTSSNLLERTNSDGETPLLLAAKLNQWSLIETVLKKRLDLIENTDKNDNNILHLLANVVDNKAYETIKNLLVLIPDHMKENLLKKKNKDNQTPIQIAQLKDHMNYADLFKCAEF